MDQRSGESATCGDQQRVLRPETTVVVAERGEAPLLVGGGGGFRDGGGGDSAGQVASRSEGSAVGERGQPAATRKEC
jgi:hypothetical protein